MIKPPACWGADISIEIYELLLLFSIITPWLQVICMKMSCRYLKYVLSRQNNSKAILRCLENVLWRLSIVEKLRLERSVFLKKSKKKNTFFFLWYPYSFWKDLSREYLVVSKFLLEVPKLKENVLICVITFRKVHDLLLTLTASFKNDWSQIAHIDKY